MLELEMIRLFFNQRMQSDRLLVQWWMTGSLEVICCPWRRCVVAVAFTAVLHIGVLIMFSFSYYSVITWMEDTGNIHYSNRQKQPFYSSHRRIMFNKFNTWPIIYYIIFCNYVYIMYILCIYYVYIMYILCMQIYPPSTMILISTW